MYLPQALFSTSGEKYFLYLSNFLICYYTYLFKDKYQLKLFLTLKLPLQEDNFVILNAPLFSAIIFYPIFLGAILPL